MSTQPNPIEVTLKDGTVVKAPNAEEAFKTVVKMYEDTKQHFTEKVGQTQAELETQRAALAELSSRVPQKVGTSGYSKDEYFRLLNDDPLKAANYLDAQRFGIANPDTVPQYFQNMDSAISEYRQVMLAANFTQRHAEDFPQDAANAKTLTDYVKDMFSQGHPLNDATMEMAYNRAVEEGKIKPLEAADERDEPPPSPGGGGAGGTIDSETQKVEEAVMSGKMSMPEFEKYLREKGALK